MEDRESEVEGMGVDTIDECQEFANMVAEVLDCQQVGADCVTT